MPDNPGAMPACRGPDGRCGCAGIACDGRFTEVCRSGDRSQVVCAADPSKPCCVADDGRCATTAAEGVRHPRLAVRKPKAHQERRAGE